MPSGIITTLIWAIVVIVCVYLLVQVLGAVV